ncbi:MAG: hypothetical protein ACREAE_04455, partial [Nitrosopumilaceae archaeon]
MLIKQKFLNENNREVYEDELIEEGLIFTESDLPIIEKLLDYSTFVYRIHAVPQGIADEIKSKRKKDVIPAIPLSIESVKESELPTIVVMDTGLNPISPLNGLIEQRDSHGFPTNDDDFPNLGHGTPVSCLATFGDDIGQPRAKLISYKIWSPTQEIDSFQGMIKGIRKYRDRSRIFVTSIGLPSATLYHT